MPLYKNGARCLLYIHIPKTAGSSIHKFVAQSSARIALHSRTRVGTHSVTPQHIHWDVLSRWIPRDFYDSSFTVVRNPYSRLASEYFWQLRLGTAKREVFKEWVKFYFGLYEKHAIAADNHIRPQVDFIGPETAVFKLEDGVNVVLDHIAANLGLKPIDVAPPRENSSEIQMIDVDRNTLDAIYDFYRRDFDDFDYSRKDVPENFNVI
ncbi:MAG: sulfotransferase family 2 domain-containing protein [Maritimibacter sp.]|uniref:sulfotransferase family 2 domain-containing protein n=1 Tax=Maritimibacter sp. TaxID=2003363 RepID=UPI001DB3E34A|nr:sulfotransferase family 2 domain-containing protein [Maritimibacter sp.]MBL6426564.1 sulfotransferase family 2 domain-containing protein [Maritimibacter sp.]